MSARQAAERTEPTALFDVESPPVLSRKKKRHGGEPGDVPRGAAGFALPQVELGGDARKGEALLHPEPADSLLLYPSWPSPVAIVSDGPYGVGGYAGSNPDARDASTLTEMYEPHARAWTAAATPETTLWFWATEVGWATVHPLLEDHGWGYRGLNVWDKGIAHVAGNVNSETIRGFPVTTEVCARYERKAVFHRDGMEMTLQDWLRSEWKRARLTLADANKACGTNAAAGRKYLSSDHQWYPPPPEMMERLTEYANEHGSPDGRPYLADEAGKTLSRSGWAQRRSKWNHFHGVTNVWREGALRGAERFKQYDPLGGRARGKAAHTNQKPLSLMRLIIAASTDPGDVVWEPFGGLCTAALASRELGRMCHATEIDPEVHALAWRRLRAAESLLSLF